MLYLRSFLVSVIKTVSSANNKTCTLHLSKHTPPWEADLCLSDYCLLILGFCSKHKSKPINFSPMYVYSFTCFLVHRTVLASHRDLNMASLISEIYTPVLTSTPNIFIFIGEMVFAALPPCSYIVYSLAGVTSSTIGWQVPIFLSLVVFQFAPAHLGDLSYLVVAQHCSVLKWQCATRYFPPQQ